MVTEIKRPGVGDLTMCQQCKTFFNEVMSLNHETAAICLLINDRPWYHYTRGNNVSPIINNGLKLGRDIPRNRQRNNSHYSDGISLCARDCWTLPSSGDKLFKVRLNVSSPLFDIYCQTAFDNKYHTQPRFYQNSVIVSGYLDGSSKNLEANIKRTNKMLEEGFDALLFEEHGHAVLLSLHEIEASNIEFIS